MQRTGHTEVEGGFTLAETLVTVALVAMLATLAAGAMRAGFGQERATARQFAAELDEARSLAAAGGNGATVFVAAADSGSQVTLYRGRPDGDPATVFAPDRGNPALALPAPVALSIAGGTFERDFAVFVASSGSVSAKQNYSPAQAEQSPLAEQPPCDAASPQYLVLAVAYGTPQEARLDLPCALAALPVQ